MNEPGLPDDIRARLAAVAIEVEILAGEEVADEDVAGPVGIVSSGRFAVVVDADAGRVRTIAMLQQGDAMILPGFRWPGVPGGRARAATDSALLVPSGSLDDIVRGDPLLGSWITRALAAGVADRELSAAIALESRVERRLILKLRQLAARWGRVTPEGVRLDLRVTHQELAEMVGAARESITVALGRLQDQGEIEVRRRTVILRRTEDQDAVPTDTA